MEFLFFIILGVVIYVFGFFMGLICASRKHKNEPCEPCVTIQDIIDREG